MRLHEQLGETATHRARSIAFQETFVPEEPRSVNPLILPTIIVALDVKTNEIFTSSSETHSRQRHKQRWGEPSSESLIPLDRFKIQRLVQRTIRTGLVQKEEFRIADRNGAPRIVESETGILVDERNEISKVFVTTRDVTAQKHLREALEKSEKRFRSMIQNGADVIALVDRRARVLSVGPSIRSVLGYAEEEFVGQNAHGFIHPGDRKSARKSFLDLVARPGGTLRTEHRIKHRDGSWRSMEGVGTNLLRDTAVHAIVLNYRDVTERKNAETASLHLAAIVQSTDDAIIGTTLDGLIVSWNKGAEQLYGYATGEMVGRSMSLLLPPERSHEVPTNLAGIKTGKTVEVYESERVTKSGNRIDVSVRVSPVHLPSGELIGASAITRDITAQKHAETERGLLVSELQHALAEVKTLRGMLPICAWCKKVRDDEGYWNRIESYLESHSQMQFTHGICPECIAKYHQHASRET